MCVQRLPSWLCGHFVCPWGETHSYYPDGSFQFGRTTQSKGIVSQLIEHTSALPTSTANGHHGQSEILSLPTRPRDTSADDQSSLRNEYFIQDFLHYIDAPGWMQQAGGDQHGVLVRQVDRDMHNGHRQVLVAQALDPLDPPSAFPRVEAEEIPLNESVHLLLNADGEQLDPRRVLIVNRRIVVDGRQLVRDAVHMQICELCFALCNSIANNWSCICRTTPKCKLYW